MVIHLLAVLIGTPAHLQIHAIIQSANHTAAAEQCIKSCMYYYVKIFKPQNGECDLSEFIHGMVVILTKKKAIENSFLLLLFILFLHFLVPLGNNKNSQCLFFNRPHRFF